MRSLKKVLPALLLALTALTAQSQIRFFEGTFSEGMKKAKEEKKFVFLDAYAAWCGPCKTMERDVFTESNVAEFFNANFISLHIDMEKGEGPALAKRLPSIDGYPSFLFLTPDGHLSKTVLGSRSAGVFLEEAKLVVGENKKP